MPNRTLRFSFLVLVLFLIGCAGKNASGPPAPAPVAITVYEVKALDVAYFDEYPAILKSVNEVELRPQVNGYITGIHFQEGTKVPKGQKLYSIDQQTYEAAYQQAVANLQVQEANLDRAQKDVERYRELNKHEAIAKQQVDYAEATYASAKKQVEAAKAAVRSVQTNVRYSTIVAPFEGRIGISAVRLGAAVSAGSTLLNTISADDPMAADITIDQGDIMEFTALQNAPPADSIFHLSVGGRVYEGTGKIAAIDRGVDPQTGSIRVRLTFENKNLVLRSGMSAVVSVKTSGKNKSIVIPHKAVTEQLGEFFVYVVNVDKVTQRRVLLGQQVGTNAVVKEGLVEGDQIAVEGVQNLREGSLISIATGEEKK